MSNEKKYHNPKKDLLEEFKGKSVVTSGIRCAAIKFTNFMKGLENADTWFYLKEGYTAKEYIAFLKALDFDYDADRWEYSVWGTVWLDDGTWMERHEIEGLLSEVWMHYSLPEIPKECLSVKGDK